VKFLAVTLIVHRPDPLTGVRKPTHDRFREVLDNALPAEDFESLAGGPTDFQHRASRELSQSKVAPVSRGEIPDPPFVGGPVLPAPPLTQESAHV
jgi:hypothetical protein